MNKWIQLINRGSVVTAEKTNGFLQLPRYFSLTNIAFESKKNAIVRNLGIPEGPKKPLTSYLRFLKDIRPSIKPTAKNEKEVTTIAAEKWKKLDESQKQKYFQAYEKEQAVWLRQNEAYKKALTKEQKLAIEDERTRLKELKEQRVKKTELKSRLKELGKPKHPSNAFLLFYADVAKKSKTSVKDTKNKYDALNESQKAAYKQKAAALREEYRKALQVWEKRMVAKGLDELVRKNATPKPAKLK